MNYEQFLQTWRDCLARSRLPLLGFEELRLDLTSLDRSYRVFVEPVGGQHARPFHVTAELSWRWRALQTARTFTRESDMVRELLGDDFSEIVTEPGWMRIDLDLHASLPYKKPLAMPSSQAWARWVFELEARIESSEPLISDERVREREDGRIEVLAWRDHPSAELTFDEGGKPALTAVSLNAWQSLRLPRSLDDSSLEQDPPVAPALEAIFSRIKRALYGWSESLDRLGA